MRALEPEHAELRQREAREHADRVQRDERRGVAVEDDDEQRGEPGEEDDAVREHEAIAAIGHLPREIAVARDDRREPGEVGERGVGGEDQDRERRELQHVIHGGAVPEHGFAQDREQRLLFGNGWLQAVREHRQSEEGRGEDARHPREGDRRIAGFGPAERGHPIGDRLDTGECHRARGEGAQHDQSGRAGEQRAVVGDLVEGLFVHGQHAELAEIRAEEADDDEREKREDVDVGRAREQPPRLLQPAQVRHRHQGDETDAEHDAVVEELGERRVDRRDTGGHRYRDGEHVVDQDRRARHQRRHLPEVLARHDIAAAPLRVGLDRLAVAGDDDREQDAHDESEGDDVIERRHARHGHEHEQDLLRRIGRRRDRVAGEHGESDGLGQPLMVFLAARDGDTDEHSFQAAPHGRSCCHDSRPASGSVMPRTRCLG